MSSASRMVAASGKVTALAWNESASALAVGTTESFCVYSTEQKGRVSTLTELCKRRVRNGVGHISLFGQSNVILFSGFAEHAAHVATLWDDSLSQHSEAETNGALHGMGIRSKPCAVAEIALRTPIVALKLHRHCVVIAEESHIHVLNERLETVETFATPALMAASSVGSGLRGVTVTDNSVAVASHLTNNRALHIMMLGPQMGTLRCVRLLVGRQDGTVAHRRQLEQPELINAHNRPVRTLCISADGSVGASISENGTAIKLIDVGKAEILRQFNRGTTSSAVHTMCFNSEASVLSCLSETGTIHFFSIEPLGQGPLLHSSGAPRSSGKITNPKSRLGAISSAAMKLAPQNLSGTRWIADATAFASSEFAFATFSLTGGSGSGSVVDDIENENSVEFSSTFATIATCAPHVGQHGKAMYAFVAQGSADSPAFDAAAGSTGFSGPRCKLVKVLLTLDEEPKCSRVSTHFFPKEDL